jgi:serine/threonine protein kinase
VSADRWRQVETLYHAARERAPEERAQFLSASCPDESVRREVESLLAHAGDGLLHRGLGPVGAGLVPDDDRGAHQGRLLGRIVLGELIGAGGMGEVYRAHDARLGRDVAVKILPASLAQHPDRLARFEREARVLASLNHPHIAAIYGFEESADLHGFVLELVEGQTLAQRLAAGPLAVSDALQCASQIADALKAAHDKGIVHRDLKPSNIKITNTGVVKVLDFGIAKAAASPLAETAADPAATREGLVLGTAPYMSPEQARGQTVDARADTWAFGCVLYEMLTGRPAFPGASTVDVLAGIVGKDPSLEALPAETPGPVRSLLVRCLTKDVSRRESDFAVIKGVVDAARQEPRLEPRRVNRPRAVAAAVIAVTLVAAIAMLWRRADDPSRRAERPGSSPAFNVASRAMLQPARLTATNGSRTLILDYQGGPTPRQVVGLVRDARYRGPRSDPAPEIFIPHAQNPYLVMNVVVRTTVEPAALARSARAQALTVAPDQPVHSVTTMERLADDTLQQDRFAMLFLTLFAAAGLVTAATGVYALLAYAVAQRRREIAVRMAIGASSFSVARSIVMESLMLALAGGVIGALGVAAFSRLARSLLFGIAPQDPLTLGTTAAVLLVTVLAPGATRGAHRSGVGDAGLSHRRTRSPAAARCLRTPTGRHVRDAVASTSSIGSPSATRPTGIQTDWRAASVINSPAGAAAPVPVTRNSGKRDLSSVGHAWRSAYSVARPRPIRTTSGPMSRTMRMSVGGDTPSRSRRSAARRTPRLSSPDIVGMKRLFGHADHHLAHEWVVLQQHGATE